MKVRTLKFIHDHLLDEYDNANLNPNTIYDVVGLDQDCFRVVNEAGEPILYPKYLFEIIDSSIPDSWIKKEFSCDEYYMDPLEFSEPGFYEDLFNGVPEARAVFNRYLLSAGIKRKNRPT